MGQRAGAKARPHSVKKRGKRAHAFVTRSHHFQPANEPLEEALQEAQKERVVSARPTYYVMALAQRELGKAPGMTKKSPKLGQKCQLEVKDPYYKMLICVPLTMLILINMR